MCSEPRHIKLVLENSDNKLSLKTINGNKPGLNETESVTVDCNLNENTLQLSGDIDLQKISCLELSNCSLSNLPDSFTNLPLTILNLSYNELTGIPNCLKTGLKFLQHLDLSHNKLQSFDEPMCVRKLCVLKLNSNKLRDVPDWILSVNCFNLQELDYSDNRITSFSKSQFYLKSSYALTKLKMNNCLVRSEDAEFFKQIRTLEVLNLSNVRKQMRNCITHDSLEVLFNKPTWNDTLKVLCLVDMNVAFLPDEIDQLVVLEELYLAKNALFWLPSTIVQLKKLQVLDLKSNKLAYLPEDIHQMERLLNLNVSHNNLTSLPEFNYTVLQRLDCYKNLIDEDCAINSDICKIAQLDLECNYYNTRQLNEYGYQIRKSALRASETDRIDGQKERKIEDSSEEISRSDDDEEAYQLPDKEAGHNIYFEECWNDVYNNECTLSDNEWIDQEEIVPKKKLEQRKLQRYPSWIFQDAED